MNPNFPYLKISACLLAVFNLSTCSVQAEIPFTQAKGMYEGTKDELKQYSPFWGMVALQGKMLERIRFFGNYQEETKTIKDPNRPDLPPRIITQDKGMDPIANLLLELFPSPDGVQFVPNTRNGDPVGNLSRDLSKINSIIEILVSTEKNPTKIKGIAELMPIPEGSPKNIADLNGSFAKRLVTAYNEQEKIANPLKLQKQLYPENSVITALLTFFVKVADDKSQLKNLPFLMKENFDDKSQFSQEEYFQIKDQGKQVLDTIVHNQQNPELAFLMARGFDAYENPFSEPLTYRSDTCYRTAQGFPDCGETSWRNVVTLFLSANKGGVVDQESIDTLKKNLISFNPDLNLDDHKRFQHMIGFFSPYEKRVGKCRDIINDLIKSYGLLNEGKNNIFIQKTLHSALENLTKLEESNTVISQDPLEAFMEGLTNHLAEQLEVESLDDKLNPLEIYKSRFFEAYPNISSAATQKAHSVWAEVVADLNDGQAPQNLNDVQYGRQIGAVGENVYEIKSRIHEDVKGIINMFNVIAKLIPDTVLNEPWDLDREGRYEQVAKKLNRLCALFSREGLQLSWRKDSGDQTITSEFMTVVFRANQTPAFDWRFVPGHFQLVPVATAQNDWRRAFDQDIGFQNNWMASLFQRLSPFTSLNKGYSLSLVYNPGLKDVDGAIQTMALVLDSQQPNPFSPLIRRWVQKSVPLNDAQSLTKLTLFLYGYEQQPEDIKKFLSNEQYDVILPKINELNKVEERLKIDLLGGIKSMRQLYLIKSNSGKEFETKIIKPSHPRYSRSMKKIDELFKEFHNKLMGSNMELTKTNTSKKEPLELFFEDLEKFLFPDTPLHDAIWAQNHEMVEDLINQGANINAENYKKEIPLFMAVWNDDEKMVQLLLNKDVNVNQVDSKEASPLHLAVQKNNINIVKLLIQGGAIVDAQDDDGTTPLYYPVNKANEDIVQLLLSKGADSTIHGKGRFKKTTPLSVAKDNLEKYPDHPPCERIYQLLEQAVAKKTLQEIGGQEVGGEAPN